MKKKSTSKEKISKKGDVSKLNHILKVNKNSNKNNDFDNKEDDCQDKSCFNFNSLPIDLRSKLLEITSKIKQKSFDEKPSSLFLNLTDRKLVSKSEAAVLKKLGKITGFKLISDVEIRYKNAYDFSKGISKEREKCSICQFEFYEEEEEEKGGEAGEVSGEKIGEREGAESHKFGSNKNIYDINEIKYPEFNHINSTQSKPPKLQPISVVLLDKCNDHFFHIECLDMLIGNKQSFKCPNCSVIYGILIGDQPYGTMEASVNNSLHCNGYRDVGTIVISYNFPSGKGYHGTCRQAYLPYNDEGLEVLGLLKVSFDRKLTFTVGTSVTTGVKNTTIWNGIHHKTSLYGGPTYFGYPDPTYFNRVKEELAAKGVVKDNLDLDPKTIGQLLLG